MLSIPGLNSGNIVKGNNIAPTIHPKLGIKQVVKGRISPVGREQSLHFEPFPFILTDG